MKFPVIRESYFVNIVILLFSLFVSFFCLAFGLAELIGANYSNLNSEDVIGVIICVGLCLIGVLSLLTAAASIQGIINKIKSKQS